MASKHQKTLEEIFDVPVRSSIQWKEIERMLLALGAEISKGNGSRVRIALNDMRAVFHRSHPRKKQTRALWYRCGAF